MTRLAADIAVIGGGLAGATAAAMLGRAGHDVVLIDPHTEQRPEFRCEKLDDSQVALLHLTGLADGVLPQSRMDGEVWISRYGRLVDRKPSGRAGIMYHDLVNSVRRQIPSRVRHIATKVSAITHDGARPLVTLADGSEISPKLAILATGLNPGLRDQLDIERETISACHSISIGFDMKPAEGHSFAFPALTIFPDSPEQMMAYLTLFQVPSGMRANLFVYWTMEDLRLRKFRHEPEEALREFIPTLERFTGPFTIDGQVAIRPIDLVRVKEPQRAGIVLVGDAYSTSCPAAGTGANKVLTDINQLCAAYVPVWLAKETVSAADVGEFYVDQQKVQCEDTSLQKALGLRQTSTGTSLRWRCLRGAKFAARLLIGYFRSFRREAAVPTGEVETKVSSATSTLVSS
jgi:2-polyprenyl-6-methoxyphenol hydroxylase-like FAD-dependent oxidoreductase